MRLHDSSFLARDGEPHTGRKPAVVNVMAGQMSRRQEEELRHLYREFCDRKMLSLAQHHAVERTMTDGSRVRIQSIQDADQVLVWPVSPDLPSAPWFAAYPVYVGLDFLPVYDRQVIDESASEKPPYPEEPKFTKPRPVQRFAPSVRVKFERIGDTSEVVSTAYLDDGQTLVAVSGSAQAYLVDGVIWYRFENYPRFVFVPDDVLANGVQSTTFPDGVELTSFNAKLVLITANHPEYLSPYGYAPGSDVFWPDGSIKYVGVGANAALYDAAGQANIQRDAQNQQYAQEYQAAIAQYEAEYATWLATTYQAWIDACKAIDDGYPPLGPYPIAPIRRSGRERQTGAIQDRMRVGVSDPHLASRFLSFPWNIGFRPRGQLSSSGSVTTVGPAFVGEVDRSIVFTLNGADRQTIVPDPVGSDPIDEAQFGHDPAHPLARDMAAPRWLFGWRASGSYQRYAAYRPFHHQELPEIRGVSAIPFQKRGDYDQFLQAGVERTALKTAVIGADGFVPEGVRLTMVFFEWEVWDRYLGEWIWTPHPALTRVDAVWIKKQGSYDFPQPYELPEGAHTPRTVRVWAATQQQRNGDMSWSTPISVEYRAWTREVDSALTSFPVGVAVIEGLPPTAEPIADGITGFPFGARTLWSGDRDGLSAALQAEWDETAANDQMIAAALRAVRKA